MADTGHGHGPVTDGAMDDRLWASLGLNVVITAAEVVGGLMAGSLALLSDAAHNLSDEAALGVAVGARRLGRRPPTPRHTYGLKRAEVIAALTNAVTLVAVTALIAREAIVRLQHPARVEQGLMLAVALVALGANVGSVLLLRRHDEHDVNVRSAFLHLAQDALASLAVGVAALLAGTRLGPYVDPAAALLVGATVLRGALSLVWKTIGTLLESSPTGVDLEALLATLVLIFASQAENITTKTLHVALIAVPILIQVYFNSSLTYGLMRLFGVEYAIAAPGALIGASNFFELAVATAIALFGPESGAALATVVGVLIEVPVMLSVCRVCTRTRHWFPTPAIG